MEAETKAGAGRGRGRSGGVVLAVVALAEAAAAVPFRYFPTEDGPTNLASARMITGYSGAFRTYFSLDFFPKFDMLWQLLLAALARLLPPLAAERVLVVGLVVGLPLAGRYAARSIRPGAGPVAYLLLPVGIGYFLHAGYHGFCLGLVLFFASVGWWLRHRTEGGARAAAVLALLLVLTYLGHAVPFLMAVGFLAVEAAWRRLRARPPGGEPARLALATAPALVLLVAYALTHEHGSGSVREAPRQLVTGLLTLRPALASYERSEIAFTSLVAATVAAATLYGLWRHAPRRWNDPSHAWLACALAAVVLYVAVPYRVGDGGQIPARVSLFALFAIVLWLAGLPLDRGATVAIVTASLVAAGGLTVLHAGRYAAFNRDLEEVASVRPYLSEGATVVPLYFVQSDERHAGLARSVWVRPVIQSTGYLVSDRGVVDLSHFQAQYDYFITQFRSGIDPIAAIGNGHEWLSRSPPEVDLLHFAERTGGRGEIDYVVVWGRGRVAEAAAASPETVAVDRQLADGYDLVFRSPRGLVELYRRLDVAPNGGGG